MGLGSNFEQQLRGAGGVNVVTYPGAPEYLADLAAGRLDAAYNDRLLVGYLITKNNLPIRGAGVVGKPEPVGVAFKKSNTALGGAVNRALAQIKADSTYARISRQWFAVVRRGRQPALTGSTTPGEEAVSLPLPLRSGAPS